MISVLPAADGRGQTVAGILHHFFIDAELLLQLPVFFPERFVDRCELPKSVVHSSVGLRRRSGLFRLLLLSRRFVLLFPDILPCRYDFASDRIKLPDQLSVGFALLFLFIPVTVGGVNVRITDQLHSYRDNLKRLFM
jgi:hypothetical protein